MFKLFELTLAVGNFLNDDTAKGDACGFKIDVMEKCLDIKSADNKSNLLMYIIT